MLALCIVVAVLLMAAAIAAIRYGKKLPLPILTPTSEVFTILFSLLGLIATDVGFIGHVNDVRENLVIQEKTHTTAKQFAEAASIPGLGQALSEQIKNAIAGQVEVRVRDALMWPLRADWLALQIGHKVIYLLILVLFAALSSGEDLDRKTNDLFKVAWIAVFILYSCHIVTATIDGVVLFG